MIWLPEQLRELLVSLARPDERDGNIRRQAIATLGAVWPRAEWLRDLLVRLTRPEEWNILVRREAIQTLGLLWGQAEWLRELLVEIKGRSHDEGRIFIFADAWLKRLWPE